MKLEPGLWQQPKVFTPIIIWNDHSLNIIMYYSGVSHCIHIMLRRKAFKNSKGIKSRHAAWKFHLKIKANWRWMLKAPLLLLLLLLLLCLFSHFTLMYRKTRQCMDPCVGHLFQTNYRKNHPWDVRFLQSSRGISFFK